MQARLGCKPPPAGNYAVHPYYSLRSRCRLGRKPANHCLSPTLGSVPSGPPTNGLLHLTLQDAIDMAVRYNLGIIESGVNVLDARGQRLHALSGLLSGGAVDLLLAMPIVGKLTSRFQVRYIIAFGWLCMALSMYYSTKRIDLTISFSSATWLRIAQVTGLGFLFVPITLSAYVGIPAEKSNAVAGMINFMRNIGSGVGTSIVTMLIARRSQFHQQILVGFTTPGSQIFQNTVSSLTMRLAHAGLSQHDAERQAYVRIYQELQAQAATLAYIDTFWVLGVGAAIMFFLSFLLKKNDPGSGGEAAAA